jgi:hypothetical protein
VNPAVACMHPPLPHGHDKRQIPTELAALEQRRRRGSDLPLTVRRRRNGGVAGATVGRRR